MKFFGESRVRRFAVSLHSGMIVAQSKAKGRVKEICEIPNPHGTLTLQEVQERARSLEGQTFRQLSGRRYDSDIIATTPDGVKVSTIQIENVYNDWLLLNTVAGLGVYEHVANAHELQVLAIARKMFQG